MKLWSFFTVHVVQLGYKSSPILICTYFITQPPNSIVLVSSDKENTYFHTSTVPLP